MEIAALRETFRTLYGSEPRLFCAPGRVNLIGEHTDYNDGFVLPMAINRGTRVAAAPSGDRRVRVRSLSLNESAQFDLDDPGPRRRGTWLDYVEGVAQALVARGVPLRGADLVIESDVAIGGGLSSSAALEISIGVALVAVAGAEVERLALALAGQEAEHTYVGINSGIMDQFTAVHGRAGHALLIDCRSLEGTPIPLAMPDMTVVVCDTRIRHTLASSEYNTRRDECESGVDFLRKTLPEIRALRDVSLADFDKYEALLPEPVRRRCRHVVTENARTLAAAQALAAGDVAAMGLLMAASHRSLREDYEVSCRELDLLVETAESVAGVAGTRMTGGGFGGCTVNLVRRDALKQFQETVSRKYIQATQLTPAIFPVEASNGVGEILN